MDMAGEWMLIFQHKLENNEDFFIDSRECLYSNTDRKFSRIGFVEKHLSKFRINGKYEFILQYPDTKVMNHWTQTVFPTKAKPQTENGFVNISSGYTSQGWGGLVLSNSQSTYIDGAPFSSNWFYPVGQMKMYSTTSGAKTCLPNPSGNPLCLYQMQLWIKINSRSLGITNKNCRSSRFLAHMIIHLLIS